MRRVTGVLVLSVVLLLAGSPPSAAAARSASAAASGPAYPHWAWPVHGGHAIVRPFIAPATQYSAGHRGIDIAASGKVFAPAAGVVHFRGFVVNRPLLSIDEGSDVLSSFEPVESTLSAGDTVRRGQVIGHLVAGHCAALCLHFGVRVAGDYVNPMLFLGTVERPVLLPTRLGQ